MASDIFAVSEPHSDDPSALPLAPRSVPPPLPAKRPQPTPQESASEPLTPAADEKPASADAAAPAPLAQPAAAAAPDAIVEPAAEPVAQSPAAAVAHPTAAAPHGFWANLVSDIRDWISSAGKWWMVSVTVHTTILGLVLWLMGTIISPAHDTDAPSFESLENLVVEHDMPDVEHFVLGEAPADAGVVGGDAIAVDSNLGGESGDAVAGLAPGSGESGGGSSSSSAAGGRGAGPGGTGGLGNIEFKGLGGGGKTNAASMLGSGGGSIARRRAGNGGVVAAGGVGQAVDGVLGGIRGELDKNDVLVCWLIDASLSLVDDRKQIAERIEPFFQEIEARDRKKTHKLLNSVISFSDTTNELVKPTTFSSQITEAIRNVPLATTGVENVMSAVQACVDQYGRKWKGGIIIVVWTDESGDDTMYLETVIQKCKRRGIKVSVVGPTAVLGSEQGRHHYVDKSTGFAFLLPIKRGPDTSLPERLFLPYWHDSPLAPWVQNGVIPASGVPWYGGPHREGLLSGVGPYALTRLALETGGTFTLLDREQDRGPFQWDVMKRYLPDYGSADEYLDLVNSKPLRKAVSASAMSTYQATTLLPPSTAFVLQRYPYYPYPIIQPYYTPDQFRDLLRSAIPQQQTVAMETARVVEQALSHFPADGMETEYLTEHSPRWRAWYDLNRGRLLAMSVRQLEYVLACQKIFQSGFLRPDTNHLILKPSSQYMAGSKIEPRAREAFRLLTRCVEKNPGTPWAMLAQWELAHELGIEIQQVVVPVPLPSPPSPPRTPDPPITFPNL